jgi:CBS domain-containing protein
VLRLQDIVSRNVVTLAPTMTLREANELLTARRLRAAPVIANGMLVGVLTAPNPDAGGLAGERAVSESMTAAVCAVPLDADPQTAAERVRATGAHWVLATEGDAPAALLSAADVGRAAAAHRLRIHTHAIITEGILGGANERGWWSIGCPPKPAA